jgi:hypothetical protein
MDGGTVALATEMNMMTTNSIEGSKKNLSMGLMSTHYGELLKQQHCGTD